MKKVYLVLVHISTILAMVFVTYFILDQYNPLMKFLDNPTSKILLLVFAIITLVINQAAIVRCIRHDSDEENEAIRKKREAHRTKRNQSKRSGNNSARIHDKNTTSTSAALNTNVANGDTVNSAAANNTAVVNKRSTRASGLSKGLNTKGLSEDEIEIF